MTWEQRRSRLHLERQQQRAQQLHHVERRLRWCAPGGLSPVTLRERLDWPAGTPLDAVLGVCRELAEAGRAVERDGVWYLAPRRGAEPADEFAEGVSTSPAVAAPLPACGRHDVAQLASLEPGNRACPEGAEATLSPETPMIDRLVELVRAEPGIRQHAASKALGVSDGTIHGLVRRNPTLLRKTNIDGIARLYLASSAPSLSSDLVGTAPASGVDQPGPSPEECAIATRLGLALRSSLDDYWWEDPDNGAARVWFVEDWRHRDGGGYATSLEAMRAYEASCRPPVSGAEDRAQVAALGEVPPTPVPSGPYVDRVRELAAARAEVDGLRSLLATARTERDLAQEEMDRFAEQVQHFQAQVERLEREAKDDDRTIATGVTAFAALHRLCDEAGVPNLNGEVVARVRELGERVGPCRDAELGRLEALLVELLALAVPGAAYAGPDAAAAAIRQALQDQAQALVDVSEILAPAVGDFGGASDSTEGHAKRAAAELRRLRAEVAAAGAAVGELARAKTLLAELSSALTGEGVGEGYALVSRIRMLGNEVRGQRRRADAAEASAQAEIEGNLELRRRFGARDDEGMAEFVERLADGCRQDQPAPRSGTGDVWTELISALDGSLSELRPVCEARRELGIQRYGVPLGRGDGRDALRDEVEELLDAAVYRQRRVGTPTKVDEGALTLLRMAGDPDFYWENEQESADTALDTSCRVADILAKAGVGPGPYVERIRTLAERARVGDALLDALSDDDGAAAVRALRALCGGGR